MKNCHKHPPPYAKFNTRWVKTLTWERELLKVFEENEGTYLYDISAKNGCLNI